MIREITIGQYYPADSVIHRLDPRVKIVATLIFIISLFMFDSFIGYAIVVAFLAMCILLSKVPFSYMVKGLKAIFMILMLTVVINMLMTPGEPMVSFYKLTITKEGFRQAIFMALRLILLIIGSSVMTLTTTPNNLTDAMESLLKPLKRFKAPVHEIAMMMSIALSFIPILIEETDKIMSAQKARGADLESGGVLQRAKALLPILIPLFVSAFRRADELALAMECRCYHGGEGRTRMKQMKLHGRDLVSGLVTAAVFAGVLLLNRYVHLLPTIW